MNPLYSFTLQKHLRERSLSIEQREGGGWGEILKKICGKISGPNILASENPMIPNRNQSINFMPQQNQLLFVLDNKNQV